MAGKVSDKPKLKITDETRAVSSLKRDPKNARRHPETQIAQIARSIEEFGYVDKMVIRPNGQLIAGEGRWLACQRLGHDKVECRVVHGLSEPAYQKLALALNKLPEGSSWDQHILSEVLGNLQRESEDLGAIGFSQKELDALLGSTEAIEVKEIETSAVQDEFWISVRGPLAQQAEALKALEQVMKRFPGVSVDLGTIALGL